MIDVVADMICGKEADASLKPNGACTANRIAADINVKQRLFQLFWIH